MTRDPFDVTLGELRAHPRTGRVVRRGRLAGSLVADVDSRVPAGAEAEAEVVLEAFDGGVSVSGKVTAIWEGECRRCLTKLEGPVVADVREIFRRGGGPDEGTYAMRDDVLNLREMVLDSLFAELPVLPLCKQDCRGICAICGADLNVAQCLCEENKMDPRWSALDVLRGHSAALASPERANVPPAQGHPAAESGPSSRRWDRRARSERADPLPGGPGRRDRRRPGGAAPGW